MYTVFCLLDKAQFIQIFQFVKVAQVRHCLTILYVLNILLGQDVQESADYLASFAKLACLSKSQRQLCQ